MSASEDVPVKKYFTQIMKMVDGILAIAVTDREGVPILLVVTEIGPVLMKEEILLALEEMKNNKAEGVDHIPVEAIKILGENAMSELISICQQIYITVKDDKLPVDAAKPRVLSSAALTFEQASKLGLGQTQNVTVFFTTHQMVCFNEMPLAVTIIADRNANTGHILSLEKEISGVVNSMKGIVDIPIMA